MKPLNDILDNFSPTRHACHAILWEYDWPRISLVSVHVNTRIILDVEHEDLNRVPLIEKVR